MTNRSAFGHDRCYGVRATSAVLTADDDGARPLFTMTGIAFLLVGFAWSLQTLTFTGEGTRAATVLWIILGSVAAGIGAGLLLAGRLWLGGASEPAVTV